VSLALRIFTLALLLGWQAVATGLGGFAHFCPKQAGAGTLCQCPHGEKKAEQGSHDQPALWKDCCDALGQEQAAPALADSSSHTSPLAAPAASPPMWLPSKAPEGGPRVSLALWDTPQAQGPPVFLRTLSLLI
jgi:hypothetical protein